MSDIRDAEPMTPGPSVPPYAFTLDSYAEHFGRRGGVARFQNTTKIVVTASIHLGPCVPPGHRYEVPSLLRVVWQPGETHAVPREFAKALRHRQGGTVGGLAPQLTNLDDPDDVQPVIPSRATSRLVED